MKLHRCLSVLEPIKNALSAIAKEDTNNIRNQYTQIDLLSAILIHELLHATDDFGSDGTDVRKSIDFTKKVLESCFSKKAVEKMDE